MKSMHACHTLPCVLLALCLALSGCVGPTNPTREISYYTFSYDPPQTSSENSLPVILQIDHFTVAPLYNTEKIVYKPASYQRKVYHYHRWQSNPGELVAYFLARDMKASGQYAAVLTQSRRLSPTHFLTGSVDEIFEDDTGSGWQAVIGITVTLTRANEREGDKAIVFQKSYKMSETSTSRNPSAVVSAMSIAMSAVSNIVMADVFSALSDSATAASL